MPAMANITIKKADGTTDLTYTVLTASGGDKSAAVWRDNSDAAKPGGQRPELRCSSRLNGEGTARRVDINFTYPHVYLDTATSITKVSDRANCTVSCVIPENLPDADRSEFAAQLGNLLASSLLKSVNAAGFAPT